MCLAFVSTQPVCILVGAFNPFTLKVIIDIYVPVVTFLIVWDWFCRSFSSLVFLDYISPFNICCKAGLVVLNSLNFCFSEKLRRSPSILMRSLPGTVILVVDFSLSVLKIYPAIPFWLAVSTGRSAVKHMGFPSYVTCCFLLAVSNILFCV